MRSHHLALFRFKVFEPDPASCAQAVPRLFDSTQEARIMLESIFEPALFRFEAISTPAGLPWRVMMISCASASRRNRDRSSLISESGTSFIPDPRTARAMGRTPIWPRSPESRRWWRKHRRISEPRPRVADTADGAVLVYCATLSRQCRLFQLV